MYRYIILLFIYVAGVTCNDIRLGYASPQDKKIYREIKEANPALWKRTDDIMICASTNEIISAVYVTDLREDKDGEAYIESGGIGANSVTISLKSPTILRGYKFEIEVYANDLNGRYLTKGTYSKYNDDTQYARKY